MSLPIIAERWIEWILEKQPRILRLRLRMTLLWVEGMAPGGHLNPIAAKSDTIPD